MEAEGPEDDAGDIADSVEGIYRSVRSLCNELDRVRTARPREGFPHSELCEALPDNDHLLSLAQASVSEWLEDPTPHTATTLRGSVQQLVNLHGAAMGLRSAVEWATEFTAIDWWVTRRLSELGLHDKHVLVAPGRLDEFVIERNSIFRTILEKLSEKGALFSDSDGLIPGALSGCLSRLQAFHILRVPSEDGISPLWRPLLLGHEIGHLRFTRYAIREWLKSATEHATSDLAKNAITQANTATPENYRPTWYIQLEKWLVEIACDSTATCIYGQAAVDTMESFLSAYASPRSTDSHPAPRFRYAVQDLGRSDLVEFRPETQSAYNNPHNQAADTLAVFALPLRQYVHATLEAGLGLDTDLVDSVAASVEDALEQDLLPSSNAWPSELVASVSSIETGIVNGLWRRRRNLEPSELSGPDPSVRDAARVGQAIDGLEFAARFEATREQLGVDPGQPMPLPNVLWVSATGVRTSPDDDGGGTPSHDLRLGRHFIVFQRNEVANLNSLGDDSGPPPIQRTVEVGWGENFVLHPSELVLAVTFESLRLSMDCSAQVLSRSSLGRLGLLSATAVQVQPGFVGCLTLELVNLASVPLELTPGQRVAQVIPLPVLGTPTPYDGPYQDAGPKPQFSLARRDWEADVLRTMSDQIS